MRVSRIPSGNSDIQMWIRKWVDNLFIVIGIDKPWSFSQCQDCWFALHTHFYTFNWTFPQNIRSKIFQFPSHRLNTSPHNDPLLQPRINIYFLPISTHIFLILKLHFLYNNTFNHIFSLLFRYNFQHRL